VPGVVPPFIAILTAFETLLLTRKARGGFQPGAGQAATNTLSISDTNALILSPSRFYRILLAP
jgi:hypothetical protein